MNYNKILFIALFSCAISHGYVNAMGFFRFLSEAGEKRSESGEKKALLKSEIQSLEKSNQQLRTEKQEVLQQNSQKDWKLNQNAKEAREAKEKRVRRFSDTTQSLIEDYWKYSRGYHLLNKSSYLIGTFYGISYLVPKLVLFATDYANSMHNKLSNKARLLRIAKHTAPLAMAFGTGYVAELFKTFYKEKALQLTRISRDQDYKGMSSHYNAFEANDAGYKNHVASYWKEAVK